MTREQIEKAAIKFAKSCYLDKYGNMNAEITEDESDALVRSIAYMFTYGAQWRINSVWHDVREQPGEPAGLVCKDWIPVCRKSGRDRTLESVRDGVSLAEAKRTAKEGK